MTDLPEPTEPNVLFVPVERTHTEYVTRNVNVHEHRAPTDESVKLLREMEAKAEAEVIKAASVGNAVFECVVQQMRDNFSDKMVWRAVFKLNGKPLTATSETDPRKANHLMEASRDAFDALRDKMAVAIATEVLNDAFVALMRERFK